MTAATDAAVLEADGVRKRFGAVEILRGMTMRVRRGDVVSLIGPSGCGKSTFLRCVNHLETIDGGRLEVDGRLIGYREVGNTLHELPERDVAAGRARIGMVFQRFNLFAHRTALQNVTEGPIVVQKRRRREAEAEGMALLEQVGLAHRAAAYPSELSGGQQQRVAIARALARRPSLRLLDEPTSALDPDLVAEVATVIRDLARMGTTMLLVTHEMGLVRSVSTRVALVDDGRVVDEGPPGSIPRRAVAVNDVARH